MTTVAGKLLGAATPQRVEMRAELVDVTGKPAVGYVPSLDGELVRPVPIQADSTGAWTVDLTPNTLVESTSGDTLWAVQEGRAKDGTPILTYIAVPETGSWWVGDIRADLSTTVTGQSTVVYLAGQPGPAGPAGPAGAAGPAGQDGTDGASAYQIAVAGGFTGTEAEWLASLVGPQGATGPQGPQPPLGAAGAGDTIALRSTDPTTTNARTPTAHKASHATGGTDALTPADIGAEPAGTAAAAVAPLDTRLDTVEAALPLKADKSGATFTGQVNVVGANLAVLRGDNTGGYQFRVTGGGVNLDLHGDVFISHFSDPAFTAGETYMMRWEAAGPHLIGRVQFGSTPYNTVHDIASATGVAGLGAKNGLANVRFCGRRATTGAPTAGAWLAGDVVQDSAGAWWLCTAAGTPGTWTSPPTTPTAHAASHATGGDDPLTAASIGALPAAGGSISGNLAVAGFALGQDTPASHGLAAWPYPPAQAVNTTEVTNGTLYLVRVNIAADVAVTKIYWWVGNSGSSPVSGQNQVGLYDSAGTLLASTTVDAAVSSAGLKSSTIAAQSLSAGSFYWVALLFNASVAPALTRGSGWTGVDAAANVGLTPATYQYAKNGTGRTALPSSITPGSNVGTDFAGPWVAVGA